MKIINKKISKKKSSAEWLRRQLSDPYVERARHDGFRARAAYKLQDIDEKFRIFKNGQIVVDLGAAPGSWSQYVRKNFPKSRVIAMDLLPMRKIEGVDFYQGDFTTDEAVEWLIAAATRPSPHFTGPCPRSCCRLLRPSGRAGNIPRGDDKGVPRDDKFIDVVLSDMAPNTTGHQGTDHLRQTALLEYALDFARQNLKPGGSFVAKSFTGGASPAILAKIKRHFGVVRHVKPPASRKDSVEMFIVAMDFK